mmetsp:Transcript_27328/g.42706  ORF Transcript_27328/g.42706 Transcript_27328/m.42706 type:complete len:181 (-) Transcript_27328:1043-1585(-)
MAAPGYEMMPPGADNKMAPQGQWGSGQTQGAATDIFNNLPILMVKQEIALIEACGIEAKNRYRVAPGASPQQTFIYAQEQSECMERICCSPCRALTMNLHWGQDNKGPIVLSMNKKSHCPMVPWPVLLHVPAWPIFCTWIACAFASQPPELNISRNGQFIGKIVDPPYPLFCCTVFFISG